MPRIVTYLALLLVAVGIVYPVILVPSANAPAAEPATAPAGAEAAAPARKPASWTGYIPALLGGLMLLVGLWQHGAARWVTLVLGLAGAGAAASRLLKAESLDLAASYPQQALSLTVLFCGIVAIACLVGKRSPPAGAPPPAA